jgi:hypothetical protein
MRTHIWNHRFSKPYYILQIIALGFQKSLDMCSPLETVRNEIRRLLHDSNSRQFPYGKKGTSVTDVAEAILKTD